MQPYDVILAHQPRPHPTHPKTGQPKHAYTKIDPSKYAQFLPLCFDNDTNCSPRNPRVLITIQIPLPYTPILPKIFLPNGSSPSPNLP
jgi:hypothetical protein